MRRAGRGGTLHAVWRSCELKISRYVWEGFTRVQVQTRACAAGDEVPYDNMIAGTTSEQ